MTWLITPKQTLSVARAAGLGERELELEEFRERGCLCMENGEASALFAATRSKSPRRRALPALYRTGAGLGPHPPRRGLPRCLSPPGRGCAGGQRPAQATEIAGERESHGGILDLSCGCIARQACTCKK